MERSPIAAGRFYNDNESELKKEIESFFLHANSSQKAIAAITPHAGYIFSGKLAGETLSSVKIPSTVILLGPNHTGKGHPVAVSANDWKIPLGCVKSNQNLIEKIVDVIKVAEIDETAHKNEHSLEVLLPILHVLRDDISIVPITIGPHSYEQCEQLGSELATVISSENEDV